MSDQRYYPSPSKVGNLHDDFRLLYEHVYRQQDELDSLKGSDAASADVSAKSATNVPSAGGPSTTKIGGLYVKGVPPQHGQSLFYNSKSGQYEPTTPAGAVSPPATNSSPGAPGQIAFDGTHVYVCVGTNSWLRATLSTF